MSGGLPVLVQASPNWKSRSFRSAIDRWNRVIPEYTNILYARVVGERESLFDVEVKGRLELLPTHLNLSGYRQTGTRDKVIAALANGYETTSPMPCIPM